VLIFTWYKINKNDFLVDGDFALKEGLLILINMKILNTLKTIRNNWKKSTFAACLLAYGVDYGHEKHKVTEMMRAYSREIVALGQSSEGSTGTPKRVTVILNPAANGR